MEIPLSISEILLYLDLMDKKRRPNYKKISSLLFFLDSYEDIKAVYSKLVEKGFTIPLNFYKDFINFIEDYDDCLKIKQEILGRTKVSREYSSVFLHQIILSKSKVQASSILEEAQSYGINLSKSWITRYDSLDQHKKDLEIWRDGRKKQYEPSHFLDIVTEYNEMKSDYLNSLAFKTIKEKALEEQKQQKSKKGMVTTYNRSIFIKEYAKKASKGKCQLCDKDAPFNDKYGNPFLEVHHIHYLSRGGLDAIDNVIALCPNCHRKMHQLELKEDEQKLKERALLFSQE